MLRKRACLPALLLIACGGTSTSTGSSPLANNDAPSVPAASDPVTTQPAAPVPTPLPIVTPAPTPIPAAPTPTPTPIAPAPSPGDLTWTSETSGGTAQLASVWGSSAKDVYAVGGGGTIVHSTGDGTWSALSSGCQDDLHSIWGASANDIYAVGAIANPSWVGSVLRSTDGGKSWSLARNAGSMHAAVWGTGSNDVYIADYHALYRSVDHGGSWSKSDLGLASAYALWSAGGTMFAAGDEQNLQLVMSSSDGFASYNSVQTGNADSILALGGTGAGDLWAVGAPGRVYHSADAGATFADVTPTGTVPGLTGVFSATPGDVWVVGNGAVFHTSDGGQSWSRPGLPATDGLSAVWGSSAHDIYLVGGSTILHGQG